MIAALEPRVFHPNSFEPGWHRRGIGLSRRLSLDTVEGLTRILLHARTEPITRDAALVADLGPRLRKVEAEVSTGARELAAEITWRVARGRPLTDIGDRVATPLQTQRLAAGGST